MQRLMISYCSKRKHQAMHQVAIMNLKHMEVKRHRRQGFLHPLWDIHK
jgi:hypothetical protein